MPPRESVEQLLDNPWVLLALLVGVLAFAWLTRR